MKSNFVIMLLLAFVGMSLSACQSSRMAASSPQSNSDQASDKPLPSQLKRLVPNPITQEIPDSYKQAVANGTRTKTGEPGPNYWQQETDYDIEVEILPQQKKLIGTSTVTYTNNSPDTLHAIYFALTLNIHKKGVVRNMFQIVNGGFDIQTVSYDGTTLHQIRKRGQTGYAIKGTIMKVAPSQPLLPGQSVSIKMSYDFKIPRTGAGTGRIGWDDDNLFFIAYFYPKVRVYDDVKGWFIDPFLGSSQFYNEFGSYDVQITVPTQWIVAATGQLQNVEEVLREPILQRLKKAHRSDEVVHVVREEDFGHVTPTTDDGTLTWHFTANKVNDFVFSVTRESMWDATRAPVGDLDSDGTTDYTYINTFYRSSTPTWKYAAQYAQKIITQHSKFTALPYPWPHMTAVEAGQIRGGGMEYPMMTLISPIRSGEKKAMYGILAHELGHEWIPMQLATNERHYAWMDEGTASFLESHASKRFYDKTDVQFHKSLYRGYLSITETDLENPIMRWSDYFYSGYASGVASYSKPSAMLAVLNELLGEKTFTKAFHRFMDQWQYKHPYPWDLFRTFEDVSGRNLDWFWRSWYYETWVLDQAVASVEPTSDGTSITIKDHGQIPMPATIKITLANDQVITKHISVDFWLTGNIQKVLHVDTEQPVTKVAIDPNYSFPDADRSNNVWKK